MADDEVDWGVDELNENTGEAVAADEDVLSLGGNEASPAPAAEAATVTGEENDKQAPTGPKSTTESVTPASSAENLDENGLPLPAGWTKIVSRTHGKIFYHNSTTQETSWEVPVLESEPGPQAGPKIEEKVEPVKGNDKEASTTATLAKNETSPHTAKVAPSGPASWRSAQAQDPAKAQGQAQIRNRDRDNDNDRDRDYKRTRMSSPTGQGNGNGNSRYPSRAEPPRRPRSPPPGPSSMSRGSSYRNDPPSGPGQGPRSNGPGLPVRQPNGPGLSNNGFGDRRRDMDPPSRPARDRSPPRGPHGSTRPENQGSAHPPSSFRPPPPSGMAGSNRAPIQNNRWGASSSGSATPSNNGDGRGSSQDPSRSNSSSNQTNVALADRITKPSTAPVVDERARLLEKKRKAQEELDKIKEEEERLEKLEAGKKLKDSEEKTRDEERIKKREEERRKEDELAEARKRGLPPAPPRGAGFGPSGGRDFGDRDRDRAPYRDDRERDRNPDRNWRRNDDFDRDRRRDDDRDYPPRRSGPGFEQRDRPSMGPGGRSPFEPSSYRPGRPMSPPPLSARLRSPPRRAFSPPPRAGGGDSYRPDRDGHSLPPPPRDLAMRMGGPPRDSRDRDPRDRPTYAEPMSDYARPRPGPPRERPLAERMSLDDRDRRYPPRDDRDRERDRDRRW